ncbi:MAG TPA: sulfatase [Polyangia bacterium]
MHASVTVLSLALALVASRFTLFLLQIRIPFPTIGRSAALFGIAFVSAIGLWNVSNDVRHVLFGRAFDARGLVYLAKRLPGLRPDVWERSGADPSREPAPGPLRQKSQARHVVLITIDTLRPDHLPVYGYHRQTAPMMTAFAARASVYEWAWAVSGTTAESLKAILGDEKFGLLAALRNAGLSRSAVVSDFLYSHLGEDRLKRSFDRVVTLPDADDASVSKAAIEEFKRSAPNFLWLHLLAPHLPYSPNKPSPFGGSPRDRYDADIREVDAAVDIVLGGLRRLGFEERTVIVIASDHGEEFGEHGGYAHGNGFHNEVLRIPLMIRMPGGEHKRLRRHVSQLDIGPTIAGVLDASWGPWPGRSLLLTPNHDDDVLNSVHIGPLGLYQFGAYVVDEWKLAYCLFANSYALYNIHLDPGELLNLYSVQSDKSAQMKSDLHSRLHR